MKTQFLKTFNQELDWRLESRMMNVLSNKRLPLICKLLSEVMETRFLKTFNQELDWRLESRMMNVLSNERLPLICKSLSEAARVVCWASWLKRNGSSCKPIGESRMEHARQLRDQPSRRRKWDSSLHRHTIINRLGLLERKFVVLKVW